MIDESSLEEKFNKIVKDLYDLVLENAVIPKNIKMTVQELNDGYTHSVATLSDIFIKANGRNNILSTNDFQNIPITNSIENYPDPVILISDEQELDSETKRIVSKRYENGYVTFPVILLSEQFFKLTYGEKFSYSEIIKTFEDSSKEKVMVFQRTEFQFLREYICSVMHIFWIYHYRKAISDMQNVLIEEVEQNKAKIDTLDVLSNLIVSQRIRAAFCIVDELEHIDKKFENHISDWQAEISYIRENYDRKVLEKISNIKAENISPFALNIDLKYGKLHGYIEDFLSLREINSDYDFITEDLNNLVSETNSAISSNKANLSLIGTFSSGKTTLINTFLGEREIPLKTSMGHNTAVLMHLFYEETNNEYYDIIYKDKLTWTIVKPASMAKTIVNKEKDNIRIQSVEQGIDGNYLIKYYIVKSKEPRSIRIRTKNGIAVKKGDILKPGAPFTVRGKQISAMVEICSKDELNLIISLIQNSDTFKMRNADETIQRKDRILDILKRISKIASEKNKTLKYDEFCKETGLNSLQQKTSSSLTRISMPEYPTKYRRIEVECNISKKNERKKLDRNGWIELCGEPNPSPDKKPFIFSEQPSCYMLAKELQLHINTEFLQYCSLTDTPGFGSVTEEHDAITEKYIRDSSGFLLVMIAINAKTMDAKYQDLINSIDDIYNNFRKKDKKNVVFILNCFTNLASETNIKKQVEKVYQMLTKYGFNRKNIFVCNLKSALVEKKQTDTMYGYPSYKKFHDFIITEMISSGLTEKYRGIKDNWTSFFKNSEERISDQIYEFENDIGNIQQRRKDLKNIINSVKKIEIEDYYFNDDDILAEYQSMYDVILDAYQNNRKGFLDNIRWNAICDALNDTIVPTLTCCNDDLTETILDYYEQCIRNISFYGESQAISPDLDYPPNAVAVLELERLKQLLSDADDDTHWYNKSSKNEYYSEKILEIINEGFKQTIENAVYLCDVYSNIVQKYKDSVIREKESTLSGLENEEKMKSHLNKLKNVRINLKSLDKKFKKIQFIE